MQTLNFETSLNPLYIANSIKSFLNHGENSDITEKDYVIDIIDDSYQIKYSLEKGIFHCQFTSFNDVNEDALLAFVSLVKKFHDSNLKIIQDFISYEELDDK